RHIAGQQRDDIARLGRDRRPGGRRIGHDHAGAQRQIHEPTPFASARSMAAPFSAIIMVGALVLPEVMAGITDASTTRKRSTPATRKRSSTTIRGSLANPILAVPTG